MLLNGQEASQAVAHIRRESLDIYNRLHSIADDIAFVNLVHSIYADLPLLRKYVRICQRMSIDIDLYQRICGVVLGTLIPKS